MEEYMDEIEECVLFGPTRIGHATFLHKISDEAQLNRIFEYLYKTRIPIGFSFISLLDSKLDGSMQSIYIIAETHTLNLSEY